MMNFNNIFFPPTFHLKENLDHKKLLGREIYPNLIVVREKSVVLSLFLFSPPLLGAETHKIFNVF